MAAVAHAGSGIAGLIVTGDIEMPDPGSFTQLAAHAATAARLEASAEQLRVDNRTRETAARSTGFEVGHLKMKQAEVAAAGGADFYGRLSAAAGSVAAAVSEVAAGHTALVRLAEAELQRPNADQAEIIRRYHAAARRSTELGVKAMDAAIKSAVNGLGAPNISALTAMVSAGGAPASPPLIDALDNSSADYGHRGENAEPGRPADDAGVAPNTRSEYQEGRSPRPGESGESGDASGVSKASTDFGSRGEYAVSPPLSTPSRQASPLGGVPSMSGLGGGGGMGSGGVPSMPGGLGGGGVSGLSSNPLTGGLGGMPGAAGGLPAAGRVPASAGAGSPAAAFSRGLSTVAGIGGGMPAMPPSAPASPSPALSPGGSAAPAAAAGGGVSPAAAQPGMVAPAAPAAPAGAGMGSAAPMMLPPGSMGPPAGAVPPPAAPTMPAGTIGGGSNAPSSAAPPSSAGGGATLVPASVVAAGQTAAARERRESADAAAAKELAWKLQYAAEWVNYIGMDWAVGIFRSPSGTETVITSNDGASFIPAGVYVPRSVRVQATDPLVDDHFRQLWFGWHDPARVLVEYARIRSETGWRLVAAATTGAVTALRDVGVEHAPSCSRDVNPLLRPGERPVAPPTLDGLHVHRLSVLWPDMYPRLLRVMEAHPVYQDRIVNAVSALMLNAATTQAVAVEGGIPDAFRRIWSTRGSPLEPSAQEWAAYDAHAPKFNMFVAMARPGFMSGGTDPSETTDDLRNYRAHWLVARTAEVIGGWSTRPLPLPDMVYAAIAVETGRTRELIEDAVLSVEDDLDQERP
jgi:hypothetical protein